MSEFRIFETEQFQEDLRKNLGSREVKIVGKLDQYVYPHLRSQPYFGKNIKKLKGFKPDAWRYRIGGFRLFYEIDDAKKIVFMIAAETRQRSFRSSASPR